MDPQPPTNARLVPLGLQALIVLGALGIVYFFISFESSFPAASIDLKLSKSQVAAQAQQWAAASGYETAGSVTSTVFNYDDFAKTFLEYELGQSRANSLMRSAVPIWYWQTRFCKPLSIEECNTWISPEGTIRSFKRTLENDRTMPSLSHDDARKKAETFLKEKIGIDVLSLTASKPDFKLIKKSSEKLIHREDHYFTWEDERSDYKGGKLRVFVSVSGDTVTEFNHFLYIPESFTRKFDEIRSHNDLLKHYASVVYVAVSASVMFIFLWAFASGKIRWKFALLAGFFAMVLTALNWANEIPSLISSYSTTMSLQGYVVDKIVSMVMASVSGALSFIVMIGAAEVIYRIAFPKKLSLESLCTGSGIASLQGLQGIIAGLAVFGIHSAYVVAFYLAGEHVGFWTPLEVRDVSVLSSIVPAFSAMCVGLSAGSSEELLYRVIGLFLFQKVIGFARQRTFAASSESWDFWIANFLQAASWAFMHSDYAQEPPYARGLELTIGGFFYGYILRRYGLLPCFIAHYTYDAFLGVTPLFSANNALMQWSSLLAVAPPVVALSCALYLKWQRGSLSSEAPLLNESVQNRKRPPRAQEAEVPFDYKPLSVRWRCALVLAAVALTAARFLIEPRTVGVNAEITVTRKEAIETARHYLLERKIRTDDRSVVAWLTEGTDGPSFLELQYVFEKVDYKRTAELVKRIEIPIVWRVRFFKPLDPREYYVNVTTEGTPKAVSMNDIEEEDAAGDKLALSAARSKVEGFLHTEHPEFEPYVFDTSAEHERKQRVDFDLTYKNPQLKVGEAEFKISSGTVGGTVSELRSGWQIPDNWLFEKRKVKLKDQIMRYAGYLQSIVIAIAGIWWLIGVIRSQVLHWRIPIFIGLLAMIATIIADLNHWPILYSTYNTEHQLSTFLNRRLISTLTGALSSGIGSVLMSAFALASYRLLFPTTTLKSVLLTAFGRATAAREKFQFWLDAVVVGFCCNGIVGGVEHLFQVLSSYVSPNVKFLSLDGISAIGDQWSPAVGALVSGLSAGGSMLVAAAILAGLNAKYNRRNWQSVALIVLGCLIVHSTDEYWQDYLSDVGSSICIFALCYFFIARCGRLNLPAYVLFGFFGVVASAIYSLSKHGFEIYYANIVVLSLALAAPIVYVVWLYFAGRGADKEPASAL